MTRDQLGACIRLSELGWHQLSLPICEEQTPIPGLLVFADPSHSRLLMVTPSGETVDLLEVYRLAYDTCRHWHDYPDREHKLPSFVGDFGRLLKLARAVTPKPVDRPPSQLPTRVSP